MKFKVGDMVQVNGSTTLAKWYGATGIVVSVSPPWVNVEFPSQHHPVIFNPSSLDLMKALPIPKFKVGDKVSIINPPGSLRGQRFIIREIRSGMCGIDCNNNMMWYYDHELILEDSFVPNEMPASQPKVTTLYPMAPVTLQDAMRSTFTTQASRYHGQPLEWFKQGRCPQCGELGRYSISQAICNKHGSY